jgi:hypothetical protein
MRLKEIMENTVSGGIATVAMPMGEVITRTGNTGSGKYTNPAKKTKPQTKGTNRVS